MFGFLCIDVTHARRHSGNAPVSAIPDRQKRPRVPVRRSAVALTVATGVLMLLLMLQASTGHANPAAPPEEAIVEQARALVARIQAAPRGPYSRIRWFCNDGSIRDPEAYACKAFGGGRQHADYSADRKRLAALGYHVGTIVAALTLEELWDPAHRHARLRELPMEKFLIETQDGWVLRRARDYRGRVQIEDEESNGRALLLALLADGVWAARNYLLARELAAAIPHGADTDLNRSVRRLAQDIAERERTFERLRVEVHTRPSVATIARVTDWARNYRSRPGSAAEVGESADTLAAQLDSLFGPTGRAERMRAHQQALARQKTLDYIADLLEPIAGAGTLERLQRRSMALASLRAEMTADLPASVRLAMLDASREVEAEIRLTADAVLAQPGLTRRQMLITADHLAAAAYGAGLLTEHERRALGRTLVAPRGEGMDRARYVNGVRMLSLATSWALGNVRYTFAEAIGRYAAIEPAARLFSDDLLRGSALESYGRVMVALTADAQLLSGVTRTLLDQPSPGLLALNPGYAEGRLRVIRDADLVGHFAVPRDAIVLVPETIAELPPVAGVLTLGEGNPVSHVQLLARNFGIPNVKVDPADAARLEGLDGTNIVLAVGSDGRVVVRRATGTPAETAPSTPTLTVPAPDLSVREPLPLTALDKALSGRVVGPKAANLGELNRLFPGQVAPAIALPFGIFDAHLGGGADAPLTRLADAYAKRRRGQLDDADFDAEMADIRARIAAVRLNPALVKTLTTMMAREFGAPNSYGVFVRSDTNVEDLPGFTGAGLNETLPNVVGLAAELAGISRVWSSMLSPRAIAWRANLLTNPEQTYASVLLMKSVPSEKSGVLITTDLMAGGTGLTVSTAWGVGGAVAGEAAEAVVLQPDGSERLLSEAKAAYRRRLVSTGGIEWLPARDGAVLTPADKDALRQLAVDVAQRYPPINDAQGRPQPWDVEFGFVAGELTLFQIRPLVERGAQRADRLLDRLLAGQAAPSVEFRLEAPPLRTPPVAP
jgi:hypothetical protein